MLRFEDLDADEQRNEILKGIHNQLAQINKWLEVITARYVKLSSADVEELRFDAEDLETHLEEILFRNISNTGYSKERGLYKTFMNGGKETYEPLGEYDSTAAINEQTGNFKDD